MDIVGIIERNWAVVAEAPVASVLMLGVAYALSRLWHNDIIKRQKEHIEILEKDRAYANEKAGSDDPKDLADRIVELENQINQIKEDGVRKLHESVVIDGGVF